MSALTNSLKNQAALELQPRIESEWPLVSIIMPIRNEARFIKSSLSSVLTQEYPRERLEVILLDGLSTDGTREAVEAILNDLNNPRSSRSTKGVDRVNVWVLDNEGRIVPTGLNKGIAVARGEIVVRVDAHTVLSPNYVAQSVRSLKRTGADVVGGLMTPVGKGWIGETIALAHGLRFGLGGALFHRATQETEADTVYMGVFRREIFQRVGLFNENLVRNQDIELNGRVRRSGGRVLLSPEIRSLYFCRNTLRDLWVQNYRNGLWVPLTVSVSRTCLSYRHFVPLIFVLSMVLSTLAAILSTYGYLALFLILGSYTLCLLTASVVAARAHGWRYVLTLPIVFVNLHVSYGIGSLVGMTKTAGEWLRKR
jgi:succinoglycan biosynthesis protein ExoA